MTIEIFPHIKKIENPEIKNLVRKERKTKEEKEKIRQYFITNELEVLCEIAVFLIPFNSSNNSFFVMFLSSSSFKILNDAIFCIAFGMEYICDYIAHIKKIENLEIESLVSKERKTIFYLRRFKNKAALSIIHIQTFP